MHLRQSPQLSAVNGGEPRPARGGDDAPPQLPALLADDGAGAGPPPARSSAGPSRPVAADAAARESPLEVEAAPQEAAGGAAAFGAAQLLEGAAAAARELTVRPAEAQRLHRVPGDTADMAAEGPPRRQGHRCGLAGRTLQCTAACQGVSRILSPAVSPAVGQRWDLSDGGATLTLAPCADASDMCAGGSCRRGGTPATPAGVQQPPFWQPVGGRTASACQRAGPLAAWRDSSWETAWCVVFAGLYCPAAALEVEIPFPSQGTCIPYLLSQVGNITSCLVHGAPDTWLCSNLQSQWICTASWQASGSPSSLAGQQCKVAWTCSDPHTVCSLVPLLVNQTHLSRPATFSTAMPSVRLLQTYRDRADTFNAGLQGGRPGSGICQILGRVTGSLPALAIRPQHMLLMWLATCLQVGAIVGMDSGSDEGEVEEQGAFKCRFSGHCHLTTHREASSTWCSLPHAAVGPCAQPAPGGDLCKSAAKGPKYDALRDAHTCELPAVPVVVLGADQLPVQTGGGASTRDKTPLGPLLPSAWRVRFKGNCSHCG